MVFNIAYRQPANNIIAENLRRDYLSELVTRVNERRKRIKEIITDINSSSDQHSNSVEPANLLPGAVDQLSNPAFKRTLPFPFVGSDAPIRFNVVEGNWEYVGRTKFKELLQEFKMVRRSEGYNTLWLYGTQGYGKSHLLAALVCYLAAQDERVVYISDCRALLDDSVEYLLAALLFAWAGDIATQDTIMALNTLEEIREFFKSQKQVIFVMDQMNALKNDGSSEKEKRQKLSDWIRRFTDRHKKVYSSSANNADYHKWTQNQNQNKLLPVYGGLTEVSPRKIMS
jgi:Cdc6-like AAA superfamily ATPase